MMPSAILMPNSFIGISLYAQSNELFEYPQNWEI